MRQYLAKSITSNKQNINKINGLLAEIDLRQTISKLGFDNRISQGGWIIRSTGAGMFAHQTSVLFPKTIFPDIDYSPKKGIDEPPIALHTICSTMHQIGVHSYFCVATIEKNNNPDTLKWHAKQLGIPNPTEYSLVFDLLEGFKLRKRRYNFLQYNTDTDKIPDEFIAEEFTMENLRVELSSKYMFEISDIDGVIWGQQYTYPIEIKEKTVAHDNKLGDYFGLDLGPFVKLAFYAAKKGNLHSLFFVREINNVEERKLVKWWFITFDKLAQFASWIPMKGGISMMGRESVVVRIPKSEFSELTSSSFAQL